VKKYESALSLFPGSTSPRQHNTTTSLWQGDNQPFAECLHLREGFVRIPGTVNDSGPQVRRIVLQVAQSQAQRVWKIFFELCRVPRPSGREEQVIRWMEDYLRSRGWQYRKDHVGNIVARLPASDGYQNATGVVLQAHLDMVCEKSPETEHDFLKDPIRWHEDQGWIRARGTTLGADNGIGIALALALAEEKDLPHPPLELLFTVDEETGLTGAAALTGDFLQGRRLLNLDSEDEGVFTLGCAGGVTATLRWEAKPHDLPAGYRLFRLCVGGLVGGHSGININLPRGNAVKVLAGILQDIRERIPTLSLAQMQGGSAQNAIPRDCTALLALPEKEHDAVRSRVRILQEKIQAEYRLSDPEISVSWEEVALSGESRPVLTAQQTGRLLDVLLALPHGADRYSPEVPGLVETSANLAKVTLQPPAVEVVTSQRSARMSGLDRMRAMVEAVARLAGVNVTLSHQYPPWEPDPDSRLLALCRETYKELFQREPVTEIIHAGLECGLIGEKYPGMEMISLGPNLENPHSPREGVEVESVDKVWRFLLRLLPALK